MKARECENCGKPLEWGSISRRTCSDTCRKALSRRKEKVKHAYRDIMSQLSELRMFLKRSADMAPLINPVLESLEAEIRDMRRLRPDDDMKARIGMQYDVSRKQL